MRCYIIKLLSNPCSTHILELLPSPLHVRAHKPGLLVSYACLSPTRSTPDDMGPQRDRTLHPAPRRADQRCAPIPLQPCSPTYPPSSLALLDDALRNPRLSRAPTAGRTVLPASELHDVTVPSSPHAVRLPRFFSPRTAFGRL